jgi:hypothetical protein
MAAEKKVGITFEGHDKTASAFDRVQQRLKQIRKEERESGEAIFKRTIAGGAGSIIDAGADMLGAGAAVFAIDMVGRALNATIDKVREIRKEMKETGATANEMGDKLMGTVPVYGQLWQFGRKLHDELAGTTDALEQNAKAVEQMKIHFEANAKSAQMVKDAIAESLALAERLTREKMLQDASPTERARLQAGFEAKDEKAKRGKALDDRIKAQEKLRDDAVANAQAIKRIDAEIGGAAAGVRVASERGEDASKFQQQLDFWNSEKQRAIEAAQKPFNENIRKLKEQQAKDDASIDASAANKAADAAKKLAEKRAAVVAEAEERAKRAAYETRQQSLRLMGENEVADVEQAEETKRRALLDLTERTDKALRDAELTREDTKSDDPRKQRAAQDLLNVEKQENASIEVQKWTSVDAIRKGFFDRQKQRDADYLRDRQEAQDEMLELDRREQSMQSELRARGLDAEGKHLDAKLERIRQHYAERIAEAKTAAEREALAKLQADEEADAKSKEGGGSTPAIAVSAGGKQAIQSALLGRELSGLRERFETDDTDRNLYLRTAVAAEATARAGEDTAKAVQTLAQKEFTIKGRKV